MARYRGMLWVACFSWVVVFQQAWGLQLLQLPGGGLQGFCPQIRRKGRVSSKSLGGPEAPRVGEECVSTPSSLFKLWSSKCIGNRSSCSTICRVWVEVFSSGDDEAWLRRVAGDGSHGVTQHAGAPNWSVDLDSSYCPNGAASKLWDSDLITHCQSFVEGGCIGDLAVGVPQVLCLEDLRNDKLFGGSLPCDDDCSNLVGDGYFVGGQFNNYSADGHSKAVCTIGSLRHYWPYRSEQYEAFASVHSVTTVIIIMLFIVVVLVPSIR